MGILLNVAGFALKQLAGGACQALGLEAAAPAVDKVAGFLGQRFTDHSQRLTRALQAASESAWKALEIALAGDTFWERCKKTLTPGESQALAAQVRAFLDATPLPALPEPAADFRRRCLEQLRTARQQGALADDLPPPASLAAQAGAFARFADPVALLEADWRLAGHAGEALQQAGYPDLGRFLSLRSAEGPPLLALAVRYFFRRQVEQDAQLFQGLAFAQLEKLAKAQEQGFTCLAAALAQQGRRLEELLADVHAVAVQTRDAVLDLQEQVRGQSDQLQQLVRAVLEALERHQLRHRELRPGDSLAVRGAAERRQVTQLVAGYRALPEEQRRRVPGLLNAVGKLEVVAGDFEAAQRDFQEAAALAADPALQAEAHYHGYQAALQRRDWPLALSALLQAVGRAPQRLAPFPVDKYQPLRILGAGGFGVAFLCRHRYMSADVVVKALSDEGLDAAIERVFSEATVLRQLDHPAIIRVQDCGYADAAARARPYLVMDYFEGQTLEEAVREAPLDVSACLQVARQMAEGLRAAHERGILHRDVKPANVLVRSAAGEGGPRWQVKLIDFGLALRSDALDVTRAGSKTLLGHTIAGTFGYAAPEQLGRLEGAKVGPAADVYGFAKTCCQALFQTPEPTPRHWQKLPPGLTDLLGDCLERRPEDRPADFGAVLQRLAALGQPPPCEGPSPQEREAQARAEEEKRRLEAQLREEDERRYRQAMAQAEQERRQKAEAQARAEEERRPLQEKQRQADNLRRWQESGEPQAWVEARGGAWDHAAWLGLLDRLRGSAYWPLSEEAVGRVLEQVRAEHRRRQQAAQAAPAPVPPKPTPAAGPKGDRAAVVGCLVLVGLIAGGIFLYNVFFGDPKPVQPALSLSPKIKGALEALVFRPDGQSLAALMRYNLGDSGVPLVWDLRTSNLVVLPSLQSGQTAYDRDGRRVAYAPLSPGTTKNNRLAVWDVDASRQVAVWDRGKDAPEFFKLVLSPDGKRVAAQTYGYKDIPEGIFVWNPDAAGTPGRRLWAFGKDGGQAQSLAFSPDGRLLALGSYQTEKRVKVWDLAAAGESFFELVSHPSVGNFRVDFSPNGKWLFSRGEDSKSLKVWEVARGAKAEPLSIADHTQPIFSPSGDLLAFVLNNRVRMWDLNTRREVATLSVEGSENAYWTAPPLAFHPAGKLLAAGGGSTVKVWEFPGGKEVASLSLYGKSFFRCLAFSPDGRFLAVGTSKDIQVWDSATWQHVVSFASADTSSEMRAVTFRPDSQRVAAVQAGVVRLWDIPRKK